MSQFSFKDTTKVRDQMQIAVQIALQEALKTPLHIRILNSNVSHDKLQPSGDLFYITMSVEVHPKKEENDVPINSS